MQIVGFPMRRLISLQNPYAFRLTRYCITFVELVNRFCTGLIVLYIYCMIFVLIIVIVILEHAIDCISK